MAIRTDSTKAGAATERQEIGGGVYQMPRHDTAGAITEAWMVGHGDRHNALRVEITRAQVYPQPARVGPAWYWTYSYTADGGPVREYGQGLQEARRILRRRFPRAEIVETWKS